MGGTLLFDFSVSLVTFEVPLNRLATDLAELLISLTSYGSVSHFANPFEEGDVSVGMPGGSMNSGGFEGFIFNQVYLKVLYQKDSFARLFFINRRMDVLPAPLYSLSSHFFLNLKD